MRKYGTFYRIILITLISIFISFAADPVAVVIKNRGQVNVTRAKATRSQAVKKGFVLYDGDKLRTATASFCALKFIDDKSLLRIKENSSCTIEGKREEDHINKNIVVEIGSFFTSLFRPRGSFTVTTPTSVASVKGTDWWTLQLADGRTIYIVLKNAIDTSNKAGKFLVRQNQTAIFTSQNRAPEISVTDPSQIPGWDEGAGGYQLLEIEFQDADGKKKNLQIGYQQQ